MENRNDISGVVNGPAVQVGVNYGGVNYHVAAEAPRVDLPRPSGWADAPELPDDVRALLRAQISMAQTMPYKLPGARRPSLATVYVRQELGGVVEEPDQHRPAPALDHRGRLIEPPRRPVARTTVRPPSRAVREALDDHDHLIVTGGPGQGKSTLSLRLAADIAKHWATRAEPPLSEPVVPLRLPARLLAPRVGMPFADALAEAAGEEYGSLLPHRLDPRVLVEPVMGCRWLLLVDGLDEVADAGTRDRLVTVLAHRTTHRVVLTTRPIGGAALAPLHEIGAQRYELQPFDEAALTRFADNWFGHGERFVRQVREAHLDELVRVPLLATIAGIIFEQRADHPLPDNQYELYEAYLKYLRDRPLAPSRFDSIRDSLLEHLGCVRLEADTSLIAAARDRVGEEEGLGEYLTSVGPLTPRGDDVSFLHHSFAEHLAAKAKARILPPEFDPAHEDFVRLVHTARSEERGRHARMVLLHYCHLHLDQADGVVRWLHQGDDVQQLIAAQLLAWHVPVAQSTLEEFLATVRAWAATTSSTALKILAQASRAHHPGLVAWLTALASDAALPWASRIEAAAALAIRIREQGVSDAAEVLSTAAEDRSVSLRDRLSAAEALSQCGPDERAVALRSLRATLTAPGAEGTVLRDTALVLVGLGVEHRTEAVEALLVALEDPCAADEDKVAIATGLSEVSVEHQALCAEVFVVAMVSDGWQVSRNAAAALADQGSRRVGEAAELLSGRIADRALDTTARIRAAEALAAMGPQYRRPAGQALLKIANDTGHSAYDRVQAASLLSGLGVEFHVGVVRTLREVIAVRHLAPFYRRQAAEYLAELGPEYHTEAARAFEEQSRNPHQRLAVLESLAQLGGVHREVAVTTLRKYVADRDRPPRERVHAARVLVRLSTDHHDELGGHMVEVAAETDEVNSATWAWRVLEDLGLVHRDSPGDDLVTAIRHGGTRVRRIAMAGLRIADGERAAQALLTTLRIGLTDPRVRTVVDMEIVRTGRRYHDAVVVALSGLYRSGMLPFDYASRCALLLVDAGERPRARFLELVRCVVADPDVPDDDLLVALTGLKDSADPEDRPALEAIMMDGVLSRSIRIRAASALCEADRSLFTEAVALAAAFGRHMPHFDWAIDFHERGAGLVELLMPVVVDVDCRGVCRERATMVLSERHPEQRGRVSAFVQGRMLDDFLGVSERTKACAAATLDEEVAHCREVFDDGKAALKDRAEAASRLVELGEVDGDDAIAFLRRVAADRRSTMEERRAVLRRLEWLSPPMSVISALREALDNRPDEVAVEDRMVSLGRRVHWMDDGEALIRDVLDGAETDLAERVKAAVELARLRPALVQDAAESLWRLRPSPRAYRALAEFGRRRRHEVVAELIAMALDEGRRWQARREAALLVVEIMSEPDDAVVEFLNGRLDERSLSDRDRRRIARGLLRLDVLRGVRDSESARASARWRAAMDMYEYDVADRAAGAKVLRDIANDPLCRPALRWRAARGLATFGVRGQEWGSEALEALMGDETLSVRVRASAAQALGLARPDLRIKVRKFLWKLAIGTESAVRLHVLLARLEIDLADVSVELRTLSRDGSVAANVRARAAWAAAQAQWGLRDSAAVVLKEIAFDRAVARHVRVKAARWLAFVSAVCRPEARALLAELRSARP
ncbi:hypothetical protein GCM10022243_20130 [Saccharothrix violaceirubra]|uniref:NACHT domain-containing protein n=1 Tax=Saccharothrix violaceirubra TaxID=413306 RepID=A0A7W7T224_9PSEU|nr:NACHT domain-containing protein [Saccharothrix violaceirubra]MBB4965083.1 hypothetical protein [Saccharothrix violaceirubra]